MQSNKTLAQIKAFVCQNCGVDTSQGFCLSEINRLFLEQKHKEGNLDNIVSLARIVNEQFPELVISSETKVMASSLVSTLENTIKNSVSTLTSVSSLLSQVVQKVPEDIRHEITTIMQKLETLESNTSNSSNVIIQTFSELINKPCSKGKVAEKTLSNAWQMSHTDDIIDEKGHANESDFLVTPKFKNNYGNKISVERKAGIQRYNSKHVQEAITHAKEDGAMYTMIVYDSAEDNLPDTFGPIFIDRVDGIVMAVTDVENNGWMVARYVFSILEHSITHSNTEGIDLNRVQERIKDMYDIRNQISKLRKKSNAAMQGCEGVRDAINTLEVIFEKNLRQLEAELGLEDSN